MTYVFHNNAMDNLPFDTFRNILSGIAPSDRARALRAYRGVPEALGQDLSASSSCPQVQGAATWKRASLPCGARSQLDGHLCRVHGATQEDLTSVVKLLNNSAGKDTLRFGGKVDLAGILRILATLDVSHAIPAQVTVDLKSSPESTAYQTKEQWEGNLAALRLLGHAWYPRVIGLILEPLGRDGFMGQTPEPYISSKAEAMQFADSLPPSLQKLDITVCTPIGGFGDLSPLSRKAKLRTLKLTLYTPRNSDPDEFLKWLLEGQSELQTLEFRSGSQTSYSQDGLFQYATQITHTSRKRPRELVA